MNKRFVFLVFLILTLMVHANYDSYPYEYPENYSFNYIVSVTPNTNITLYHCIVESLDNMTALGCFNQTNSTFNITYELSNKEWSPDYLNNSNLSDYVFEYLYLNESYPPIYTEHVFNWTLNGTTITRNVTFEKDNNCFVNITPNINTYVPIGSEFNITYTIDSVYTSYFKDAFFQPSGKEHLFSNLINSSIWVDGTLRNSSISNLVWGDNKTITYVHPGLTGGYHNITIIADPSIDSECLDQISTNYTNYVSDYPVAYDVNLTRPENLIINMSLNFTGNAFGCSIPNITNATVLGDCICNEDVCFVDILPGSDNVTGVYLINSTENLTANFSIEITKVNTCNDSDIAIDISDVPYCNNDNSYGIILKDNSGGRGATFFTGVSFFSTTPSLGSMISFDEGSASWIRQDVQNFFEYRGESIPSYDIAVLCNKTGNHSIRFDLVYGETACYLQKNYTVDSWNVTHVSSSSTSLPNVTLIGNIYQLNYTLFNDGTEDVDNVSYNLDFKFGLNTYPQASGTSGLIQKNQTWNVTINVTPEQGGLGVLTDKINYGFGENHITFSETYVNYDPALNFSDSSPISHTWESANSYTMIINLSSHYSDNDYYDNYSNAVWSYIDLNISDIAVNIVEGILNITVSNYWIGNEDLIIIVNDTYNSTSNDTIKLSFSKQISSGKVDKNYVRSGTIILDNKNNDDDPIDSIVKSNDLDLDLDDIISVIPIIEQPTVISKQEKIETFVKDELRYGSIKSTRYFEYIDGNTRITERFKNLNLFDKHVTAVLTFPKDIVERADHIKSPYDFLIIEMDPIIQFDFFIDSYQENYIQYSIGKQLTQEDLDRITLQIIETQLEDEDFDKIIKDTKEVVNINQSYTIKDNKTTFTIDLDIQNRATLTDVSIFQEIPKCLIEIINEQMIESENKDFEIINVDPLIVWHFDTLLDAKQIQYTITATSDENCTNQVATLALAKNIILVKKGDEINLFNLWLSVGIIPLVVLLFVFYGFLVKKKEHDDKEKSILTKYVMHHYRHGFNKEQVRAKLISEGYDDYEVDECLHLHTKHPIQFILHRLEIGFDEFILFILITLNILDFTEFGSFLKSTFGASYFLGDVDYLKKIISWALLAYLLYRVSITEVLFGKRRKFLDVTLIISFFLFTFKNIISYAKVAWQEVDITLDLYSYLINHNVFFEKTLFLVGIFALIFVSLFITEIGKKSFLGNFHIKNPLQRILLVNLALIGFFVIVFNLMMEWLAIAVDALILVITLLVMIYIILKHRHKFKANKVFEETSAAPERFYESFIKLFHYKKTLFLGVSGMLILHALTEVGNFLVPYVLGVKDAIYFGNFYFNHQPLFFGEGNLLIMQTAGLSLVTKIGVVLTYLGNVLALLTLFIIPALLWSHYYRHKNKPNLSLPDFVFSNTKLGNAIMAAVLSSSVVLFILNPVFKIKSLLGADNLAGVDIWTQPISLEYLWIFLGTSLLIGLLAFLGTFYHRKLAKILILPTSFVFFSYYITLFATSIYKYNVSQLVYNKEFVGYYTFCLGVISILFLYFAGYLIVLYLYLPNKAQTYLSQLPVVKHFLQGHDHHHIEFYDQKYTEDDLKLIEDYILKSKLSDFECVENLIHHDWTIEAVREAVRESHLFDKRRLHLIFHYHNNKERVTKLSEWMLTKVMVYSPTSIIESLDAKGWPKDDIDSAILLLEESEKRMPPVRVALTTS